MPDSNPATAYLVRIPVSERMGLYAVHQKVNETCGPDNRPLWRNCPGYALVVSRVAPEGYQSRPFDPAPQAGRETRFDLLAEVSVARKRDGETRGKRRDPILEARFANRKKPYAEITAEIAIPWLSQQGGRHGFEVLTVDRCEYEVLDFVRQRKPMRVGAVRFAGRLRVTDPEKFAAAMLNGIGHSKAWGCGLLLCFGA